MRSFVVAVVVGTLDIRHVQLPGVLLVHHHLVSLAVAATVDFAVLLVDLF